MRIRHKPSLLIDHKEQFCFSFSQFYFLLLLLPPASASASASTVQRLVKGGGEGEDPLNRIYLFSLHLYFDGGGRREDRNY